MNVDGEPYVIEYNVRMGDPETEVVMPRIESDLLELFQQCAKGELANAHIIISNKTATTVILVSGGYPESYEKGKIVEGIPSVENTMVFHAGTSVVNGKLVTSGGRVFACTALGNTMKQALELSFFAANSISYEGKYFRSDIGKDLEKYS